VSKKLVHDYTFTPGSNGTILINDLIKKERLLLATNATRNEPMFLFNSATLGINSFSQDLEARTTTISLTKDCSSMTDSDDIQIFIEEDGTKFQPVESYTDPVSKLRVSNPQNLIDTDFEYGLQSSKWETIELVKNIPTFFARDGDTGLQISSITVSSGSSEVVVVLNETHGFSTGAPVIVNGTDDSRCNGAFVVRSTPTETSFTFVAKQKIDFNGTIHNSGTQIFFGSIYQGTEFKLDNLNPITTDGDSAGSAAGGSILGLVTKDKTKFNVGTSFYLTNSIGTKQQDFATSNIVAKDHALKGTGLGNTNQTMTFSSDPSLVGHRRSEGVQPYAWLGARDYTTLSAYTASTRLDRDNGYGYTELTTASDPKTQFFNPSECSINKTTSEITFAVPHNLHHRQMYYFEPGLGNKFGNICGPNQNGTGFGASMDAHHSGVFTILVTSATTIKLSKQIYPYYSSPTVHDFDTGNSDDEIITDVGLFRCQFAPAYKVYYSSTGDYLQLMFSHYWNSNSYIYGNYYTNYNNRKNWGNIPDWMYSASSVNRQPCIHLATSDVTGYINNTSGSLNMRMYSWGSHNSGHPSKPPYGWSGTPMSYYTLGYAQRITVSYYTYYYTYVNLRMYSASTGGSYKTNYYNSNYSYTTTTTTGNNFLIPITVQDDVNRVYKTNHGLQTGQMLCIDSCNNHNLDSNQAVRFKDGDKDIYLRSYPANLYNRARKVTKVDDNSFNLGNQPPYSGDTWWKGAIALDSANHPAPRGGLNLLNPASPNVYSSGANYLERYPNIATGPLRRNVGDPDGGFSIGIDNHNIAEGTLAKYDKNGQTPVGGLTDQGQYYVNAATDNKIRLASAPQAIYPAGYNKVSGVQNDASQVGKVVKIEYSTNGYHRLTLTAGGWDAMGFQDGDLIQYTREGIDINGLIDGGFYYIRKAYSGVGTEMYADQFVLKYHDSDATAFPGNPWNSFSTSQYRNNRGTVPIYTSYNNQNSPIGNFRHTSIQALDSTGSGTQKLLMTAAGAVDGVYNITTADNDGKTYTLNANTVVPLRQIEVVGHTDVNTRDNIIRKVTHGLSTGAPLTYTHNAIPLGGLTSGTTYYAINSGKDNFKLAATQEDALNNVILSIDSAGANYGANPTTHTFTTNTVSGEIVGNGTITQTGNSKLLVGSGTQFTSKFSPGDQIKVCVDDSSHLCPITFDSIGNTVTNDHRDWTVGEPRTFASSTGNLPTGLLPDMLYYVGELTNANRTALIYDNYAKAVAGGTATNRSITGGSGTMTSQAPYDTIQSYDVHQAKFVNNNTSIELLTEADSNRVNANYMVSSSFLMRADGFALHRPYDGGVELIPSTNPDAQMIRQTRKYFRYQSGKGIQNSLAISFKPAVDIDTFSADSTVGTVTTRENHRLSTGLNVTFNGATVSAGTNLYNRSYTVQSVPTDRTFTIKFDQVLTLDSNHTGLLAGETITQATSGATGVVRAFATDSNGVPAGNTITLANATGVFTTNSAHTLSGSSSGTLYQYPTSILKTPGSTPAGGIVRYHVDAWSNSSTRAGLFDDQNGLFWEFDGQTLSCVVRSSTQQISGTSSVTFNSAVVTGINTKYQSQLSEGSKVVLKGQTYRVVDIASDTEMTILPSYRGVTNNRIIVTKTIDNKVSQNSWNIDKADGKGPTGYNLDLTKIQMAYIDYSWYGAGKVRFGFKDQNGDVKYVHQFIHNNAFTEAYMRSGNVPGRYEIENTGTPSYVPALAHWGTSVIMDGTFDDDKAYIFTASGNTITQTGQGALAAINMRASHSGFYYFDPYNYGYTRQLPRALEVETPNVLLNSIQPGDTITGADLPGGSSQARRSDYYTNWIDNFLPNGNSPYQPAITTFTNSNGANKASRNLLFINETPSGTTNTYSGYTTSLSQAEAVPITSSYPLVSIRLAPSVDTNTPGLLGEKEIINRMQLALKSVGILTTHAVEVELRLNSSLDNNNWQRVTVPSLSQLVYHGQTDQITGGNTIFSFRAAGGSGSTSRTPILTEQDLSGISDMGNSILGGDNVFPDGPDIITVVATLTEDPGTIGSTNPWQMSGRISWAESQA